MIDSIDLQAGTAAPLSTLGVFKNSVSPTAVLTSSPNSGNVFLASPDGTVALYTSAAGTFINSRHDFTALSGAFAASDYGSYVVGNSVLNASLVPSGVISPSPLPTSGFTFIDAGGYNGGGYMASAASASAAGSLVRMMSLQTGAAGPVLVSEAPLLPTAPISTASTAGSTSTGSSSSGSTSAGSSSTAASSTPPSIYGTYGSGSASLHAANSFTRTVAPLASSGTLVVLSTSGLTVLPANYADGLVTPSITGVYSAADGSKTVASGGLISIYGQNMGQIDLSGPAMPLATAIANTCIGVNGLPIPLLYVSPQQINAQLPFNVQGNATLAIHTPGGIGNNYLFNIQSIAPSVFQSGATGNQTPLAAIVRNDNSQLVTPTNPIHPKDSVTIYLTGMGQTVPSVQAGQPGPASPLAAAAVQPIVTLGGFALSVSYAGLTPGQAGVYQINATVPWNAPGGAAVPLVISQGGAATTLPVRVVD